MMKNFVLEFLIVFSNIGTALVVASLLVIAFDDPRTAEASWILVYGIITIMLSLTYKAIIKKED